jgi:hypothetical protein
MSEIMKPWEWVRFSFIVQKHRMEESEFQGLLRGFEEALCGFHNAEIQEAFIAYLRVSTAMPKPASILEILAANPDRKHA